MRLVAVSFMSTLIYGFSSFLFSPCNLFVKVRWFIPQFLTFWVFLVVPLFCHFMCVFFPHILSISCKLIIHILEAFIRFLVEIVHGCCGVLLSGNLKHWLLFFVTIPATNDHCLDPFFLFIKR